MKLAPATKNTNGLLLEKDGFNYQQKALSLTKKQHISSIRLSIFNKSNKPQNIIECQYIKHTTQINHIITRLFTMAFEWTFISY